MSSSTTRRFRFRLRAVFVLTAIVAILTELARIVSTASSGESLLIVWAVVYFGAVVAVLIAALGYVVGERIGATVAAVLFGIIWSLPFWVAGLFSHSEARHLHAVRGFYTFFVVSTTVAIIWLAWQDKTMAFDSSTHERLLKLKRNLSPAQGRDDGPET